jgi:hypothetical protein
MEGHDSISNRDRIYLSISMSRRMTGSINLLPKDTRGCTCAFKLEGWVDPRASADASEKNNFLHLPGIEPWLPTL